MTERRLEQACLADTSTAPTTLTVESDGRVDVLVSQAIAGWSRRRVHDLFDCGAVRINGRRARKGDRVRPGDIVTVDGSILPQALVAAPELSVRVLHEDENVIVVDKPAGMPSVARRTTDTDTVANFLVARFPEMRASSPNPLEAGLIHRLDTATSGVLLAARTRTAYERLRRTFAHTAVKDYVAVVRGSAPRRDRITLPIAHAPRRPRRMRACADELEARELSARAAETRYVTIQANASEACLALRISTGVRHQIRVHLAAKGRVIIGDDVYDRSASVQARAGRLLLHAYRLRLPHPDNGTPLDCIAELPSEFAAVLTARGWRIPRPADWDDL
jgi:23S rRNA pseudouridine1911/1915/1917 synthase